MAAQPLNVPHVVAVEFHVQYFDAFKQSDY